MSWSPPKKITVIISFIILVLGVGLFLYLILGEPLLSILPVIPIVEYSQFQIYSMIAIGLVFLAWLIMLLGVLVRGM
ncbi:MAG: hypothetical protein EU548_09740 [Promethearchaeota archaeon]|nr:MAG: hypothetical protein EU548_09740 [Candidatus Lokiarchaeota archaeon]